MKTVHLKHEVTPVRPSSRPLDLPVRVCLRQRGGAADRFFQVTLEAKYNSASIECKRPHSAAYDGYQAYFWRLVGCRSKQVVMARQC